MTTPRGWLAGRADSWTDVAVAICALVAITGLTGAWLALHPWACLMGPDAELWGVAADGWAHGDPTATVVLARQPLQPAIVGAVSWLGVSIPTAAAWVSAGATGCAAALAWWLPARWLGRGAGVIGVAAIASSPPLATAPHANADALFLPFVVGLAFAALWMWERRDWRTGLWTGALFGAALLCRPHALLALPALGVVVATRGGWRGVAAFAAGAAVVSGPWFAFEAFAAAGADHLTLLLNDLASGEPLATDHVAKNLQREGWDVAPAAGGQPWRLLWLVRINVLRMARGALPFVPYLVGLPALVAVRTAPAARRATVPIAVGASMLLALPALWQERHLVGYLVVLGCGAGALAVVAARRSGPRWTVVLGATLVLATAAAPPSAAVAWSRWTSEAVRDRCDGGVDAAAAWLRANVATGSRGQVLAQPSEPIRVLAAFLRGDEEWAFDAFFADADTEPRDPRPVTLWAVAGPRHPAHERFARELARRGLHPDARTAHSEPAGVGVGFVVYRRDLPARNQ